MKDYQFHCEGCNESVDTSFIKTSAAIKFVLQAAVRFPMKPNNAVVSSVFIPVAPLSAGVSIQYVFH